MGVFHDGGMTSIDGSSRKGPQAIGYHEMRWPPSWKTFAPKTETLPGGFTSVWGELIFPSEHGMICYSPTVSILPNIWDCSNLCAIQSAA